MLAFLMQREQMWRLFHRAIDLLSTYKEVPTDANPTKARVEVNQGVTITEAGAELPTYAAGKASLLGKDISGNIVRARRPDPCSTLGSME